MFHTLAARLLETETFLYQGQAYVVIHHFLFTEKPVKSALAYVSISSPAVFRRHLNLT